MKKAKTALAALAIAGFVVAPGAAMAAEESAPNDPVKTVGCGIVTIITLPIVILGGDGPNC